jgi:hypothetical protein
MDLTTANHSIRYEVTADGRGKLWIDQHYLGAFKIKTVRDRRCLTFRAPEDTWSRGNKPIPDDLQTIEDCEPLIRQMLKYPLATLAKRQAYQAQRDAEEAAFQAAKAQGTNPDGSVDYEINGVHFRRLPGPRETTYRLFPDTIPD